MDTNLSAIAPRNGFGDFPQSSCIGKSVGRRTSSAGIAAWPLLTLKAAVELTGKLKKPNIHAGFPRLQVTAEQF
ncbi:MAG: hypothetical protein WA129_03455 [Acidovorax sp.]